MKRKVRPPRSGQVDRPSKNLRSIRSEPILRDGLPLMSLYFSWICFVWEDDAPLSSAQLFVLCLLLQLSVEFLNKSRSCRVQHIRVDTRGGGDNVCWGRCGCEWLSSWCG